MSEKVKVKITRNVSVLPAIALRGLVVFPNNIVHFEVGRAKSIAAIEAAMHANSSVFLVAQKEMDVEEPTMPDLYAYGVIAEIKQVLRVSDDLVKVLVEGKTRARLLELNDGDFLQASVRPVPVRGIGADKRTQTEALVRSLKDCFEEYLSYSPQISKDVIYNIVSSDSPLFLSEYMPANLLLKYEDKQTILNESSLLSRLEKLLMLLRQECQVLEIERDLAVHRLGDRQRDRRLADARRADEADDLALDLGVQLAHGQQFQDALFDFLQTVMFAVQHPAGVGLVEVILGGDVPG